MKYNTQEKRLSLPEYGRNIQNMVDHCLTLKTKKERQQCAEMIITIMGKLFPELDNNEENRLTLWNQLAIMADFELDVDYPVGILRPEDLRRGPEKVGYPEKDIIYRHYGRIIQSLITRAIAMPDGKEKREYTIMIANRMKSSYLTWNRDSVSDSLIFKDLFELSGGQLALNESNCRLNDFSGMVSPSPSKEKALKNKKKK